MSEMDHDRLGLTCLVTLDVPVEIHAGPLRRSFAHISPRSAFSFESRDPGDAAQGCVFTVDGQLFGCAVFDTPMPVSEYTHAVKKSMFWPDARAALSGHQAFVAISAVTHETVHGLVRAQAVAMTRLVAALVEVLPASGVYWQVAETLTAPDRIQRAPVEIDRGKWPVDMWIGWQMFGRDDPRQPMLGIQTVGASAFLGFELRIPPFEVKDKKEPLRILYGAAAYLMNFGDVIRDGQQVEVIGERRTAYKLHLGGRDKPGMAVLRVVEQDGA